MKEIFNQQFSEIFEAVVETFQIIIRLSAEKERTKDYWTCDGYKHIHVGTMDKDILQSILQLANRILDLPPKPRALPHLRPISHDISNPFGRQ